MMAEPAPAPPPGQPDLTLYLALARVARGNPKSGRGWPADTALQIARAALTAANLHW